MVCVAAGAAFLGLLLHGMGLMVVRDSTGQVVGATATNDIDVQPLYSMPGGVFIGFPQLEGVIEIRCKDGSRRQNWYITRSYPTWVTVTGVHPCRYPA